MGRMPSPLLISDKPTYEDLMAVARHLFGDFPQVVLDELCDAATEKKHGDHARVNGESGFKIIEFAGARIKFLAKERGCKVTLDLAREGLDFAGAGIKAPADSEALRSSRAESASALVSPGRRGGIANGPPKGAPPAREMIPAGIGA